MEKRAFVLLSGGVDSTTCLFKAIHEYAPDLTHGGLSQHDGVQDRINNRMLTVKRRDSTPPINWVEAISVDYGQKHRKEFEYAAKTCALLGITHRVLNIRGILDDAGVMLTDASVKIPDISYGDIKGVSPTYVPFRNGTLLSLITAHAQKYVNAQIEAEAKNIRNHYAAMPGREDPEGEDKAISMLDATNQAKDLCGIYFGAHAEDAFNWAYPDCTPEFIGAMSNAIYTGSYYAIRLHTPIMWSSKAEVVSLGDDLGVPWENTWSCYKGEEHHCGTCPTCRARKEAFHLAGVADPTIYADQLKGAA